MKRFALSGLLFAVTLSCPAQSPTPEQQIRDVEAATTRAIQQKDFATVEKNWSPNMVVNSPANRILHRAEVLGFLKSGALAYDDTRIYFESFDFFGDIAVAMGHETFKPTQGPSAGVQLERRFTDIWQRSGDGWVQIARQATVLNGAQQF